MVDYYVSSLTGDDENDGLSPDTPWRTLGHTSLQIRNMPTGNSVFLERGSVFDDALILRVGGNTTNPMVIGTYGIGDKPIIQTPSGACIYKDVGGTSHWVIEDLHLIDLQTADAQNAFIFRGAPTYDVTIRGIESSNIRRGTIALREVDGYLIEDCNCEGGIGIMGSTAQPTTNGIIRNCVCHDTSDGITLHDGKRIHVDRLGPNHRVENCVAYDCYEEGIDVTSGSDIQVVDCEAYGDCNIGLVIGHWAENVTIDNFWAHDMVRGTDKGSGIFINFSYNAVLKNCLIENFQGDGIVVGGRGPGEFVENALIENCVVKDGSYSIALTNLVRIGEAGPYEDGITFQNNILISSRQDTTLIYYIRGSTPENTESYFQDNVWWRVGGNSEPFGSIWGVGDFTFAWWQAQDFTLNEQFAEPSCEQPICYCLTEPDCTDADCYWWNGSCHTFEEPIDCVFPTCDCATEPECTAAGCFWWSDGTCHSTEEPVDCVYPTCDCPTEQECLDAGCYWWSDGICRSTEEPVCTEGDTRCVGYALEECRSGEWIVIEQNSISCGYVPPDGIPWTAVALASIGLATATGIGIYFLKR